MGFFVDIVGRVRSMVNERETEENPFKPPTQPLYAPTDPPIMVKVFFPADSGDTLLVTGHINPPGHVRRVLQSRSRVVTADPLELSDKTVVVATENAPLRQALGAEFERRGARVVALEPTTLVDPAIVEAQFDTIAAQAPLGAVVFGLRPDPGGDLATTTPDRWNDERT